VTKDITMPAGFSIYTSNGKKMNFGAVNGTNVTRADSWENHG
jgi:hypothetical protein